MLQGLIERDLAPRQIALPPTGHELDDLQPGQLYVSAAGEGARIGTYEVVYWTGTFRYDDRSGKIRPDVNIARYTGASPGVKVYYHQESREWRHDASQWFEANQNAGKIRVDGILGPMPEACTWSSEALERYTAPLLTKEGLEKVKALGVTMQPRALERLHTLPRDVASALAPMRGDTEADVKRKRESAAKLKKAVADWIAIVKEVWA